MSVDTLLWLLLACCTLWMALRYLPAGRDWHRPLPELIALIPLLSVPILGLIVCSLCLGDWAQTIVSTLLLTLEALWQLPVLIQVPKPILTFAGLPTWSQETQPADSKQELTVMTLNCRYGRVNAAGILGALARHQVDVLALQEVSPQLLSRLEKAGMASLMPYECLGPRSSDDNGGSNALFTRVQPISQSPVSVSLPSSAVPTITIPAFGATVLLASAHPKSPQRGAGNWGASILALADLHQATQPTVVVGDLNSSLYHPSFRALLQAGHLLDSAVSLHRGNHPTFPSNCPPVPALIEIDHVLHSPELAVLGLNSIRIANTDHRALIASLKPSKPYLNT